MSVVTAQILIGHPDSFHADTWPTHGLYLFENSRPSWVLAPLLDEGVRAAAPRSLDDAHPWRELAAAATAPKRTLLRSACRASGIRCKAVVTELEGSSLTGRLGQLDDYPMDIEVCPSWYFREVDGWKGGTVRRGSL
jgi:hypothetical protein